MAPFGGYDTTATAPSYYERFATTATAQIIRSEVERFSRIVEEFAGDCDRAAAAALASRELRAALEPDRGEPVVPRVYAICHTPQRNRLIFRPPARFAFYQGAF